MHAKHAVTVPPALDCMQLALTGQLDELLVAACSAGAGQCLAMVCADTDGTPTVFVGMQNPVAHAHLLPPAVNVTCGSGAADAIVCTLPVVAVFGEVELLSRWDSHVPLQVGSVFKATTEHGTQWGCVSGFGSVRDAAVGFIASHGKFVQGTHITHPSDRATVLAYVSARSERDVDWRFDEDAWLAARPFEAAGLATFRAAHPSRRIEVTASHFGQVNVRTWRVGVDMALLGEGGSLSTTESVACPYGPVPGGRPQAMRVEDTHHPAPDGCVRVAKFGFATGWTRGILRRHDGVTVCIERHVPSPGGRAPPVVLSLLTVEHEQAYSFAEHGDSGAVVWELDKDMHRTGRVVGTVCSTGSLLGSQYTFVSPTEAWQSHFGLHF